MLFSLCNDTKKHIHVKIPLLILHFPAVWFIFLFCIFAHHFFFPFLGHFLAFTTYYTSFCSFTLSLISIFSHVSDTLFSLTCSTLLAWLNAVPSFCFASSVPHKYLIYITQACLVSKSESLFSLFVLHSPHLIVSKSFLFSSLMLSASHFSIICWCSSRPFCIWNIFHLQRISVGEAVLIL